MKHLIYILLLLVIIIIVSLIVNKNNSQQQQHGGEPEEVGILNLINQEALIPEPISNDIDRLDNERNMKVIFLDELKTNGLIKSWKFRAGRQGIVHFQIYRKNGDLFQKIGNDNIYQVTKLGENIFNIPPMKQLHYQKGDYIGLRFPELGIISFIPSEKKVALTSETYQGPTKFPTKVNREYSVIPSHIMLPEINIKAVGGSKLNHAKSAQDIIRNYKKNQIGYPVDGTYWIKSIHMKEPIQIYCNFSIIKDYGYMLVGSVSSGTNDGWMPIQSGSYPFNPHVSYGEYDSLGRVGNYYLSWAKLDPSAVIDNDPNRCQMGNFKYNQKGKFCGTKENPETRVKYPGGITQI